MYTDVVFDYFVSRKLQKEEAIRDGKAGDTQRTLRVALTDLAPEQREGLIPVCTMQSNAFHANLRERRQWRETAHPTSPGSYWQTDKVYLDAVPTIDEAVAMAVEIGRAWRDIEAQAKERYEAHQAAEAARKAAEEAAYETAVAEVEPLLAGDDIEALRAINLAERGVRRGYPLSGQIADRIKQLEREAAEAPMREWIAAHGSPRLQKALAAGADVERPYISERVAAELPGFRVDLGNDASLDEGYPSEDALDEAEVLRDQGYDAEARIITSWPDEDGYDQYDEYNDGSAEAVVIWYVYGGRHHAIKVID